MGTTDRNYNVAISFFQQRQEQFFNFYQEQYNFRLDKILEITSENIEMEWRRLISNTVNEPGGLEGVSGAMNAFKRRHRLRVNLGKMNSKDGTIQANLGRLYEPFYKQQLQKEIRNHLRAQVNNVVNSLGLPNISVKQTGGKVSTSAVVEGKKDIRSDVFISLVGLNMTDKNGKAVIPSKNSSDFLNVELQSLINLTTDVGDLENSTYQVGSNVILDKYILDQAFQYAGGLNLKY